MPLERIATLLHAHCVICIETLGFQRPVTCHFLPATASVCITFQTRTHLNQKPLELLPAVWHTGRLCWEPLHSDHLVQHSTYIAWSPQLCPVSGLPCHVPLCNNLLSESMSGCLLLQWPMDYEHFSQVFEKHWLSCSLGLNIHWNPDITRPVTMLFQIQCCFFLDPKWFSKIIWGIGRRIGTSNYLIYIYIST